MGDVGERAAMHEGRIVLQRLHEVGLHRILQQHGHGAIGLEVARTDRRLVALVGDDDVAEALLEVLEIVRKAQDRHHFRSDRDVEARLARIAVGNAAKRADDFAQRPVVHVHDAPPHHAAGVDAELVAPVDVVVDDRRQQVVRRGDGMEIAGEVQVHVLHRHDLRIAAAGSTALDAEIRPERGFANADDGLLADAVEPVAEADGGGGLALACRRRVDRGDEDQLAIRAAALGRDEFGRDLRLVVAIGQQVLIGDADLFADFLDRPLGGGASDLDVGLEFGHGVPLGGERVPEPRHRRDKTQTAHFPPFQSGRPMRQLRQHARKRTIAAAFAAAICPTGDQRSMMLRISTRFERTRSR